MAFGIYTPDAKASEALSEALSKIKGVKPVWRHFHDEDYKRLPIAELYLLTEQLAEQLFWQVVESVNESLEVHSTNATNGVVKLYIPAGTKSADRGKLLLRLQAADLTGLGD